MPRIKRLAFCQKTDHRFQLSQILPPLDRPFDVLCELGGLKETLHLFQLFTMLSTESNSSTATPFSLSSSVARVT